MEEKERYQLFGEHCIKDNNPDARCQLLNTYQVCVILNEQDKENQQLKEQLAEKEKEYQSFKKIADGNVNYLKNRIFEETRNYNQDKISFAVEQLTLFKNSIVNKMNNPYSVNIKPILSDFDNQIKELKGVNYESNK